MVKSSSVTHAKIGRRGHWHWFLPNTTSIPINVMVSNREIPPASGYNLQPMATELIEFVERMPHSPVVLVGDLMVDRYLYGNAERLSAEAPVPILKVVREEHRLGGAGNVAADLAALEAEVRVVGIIGKDPMAQTARGLLSACHAKTDWVIECPDRPTIAKVRLVGLAQHRHPQQMMRLDYEETAPIDDKLADDVLERVESALEGASALCIEDYNKGMLTSDVCQRIIKAAKARGVPVLVDPAAINDYRKYRGCTTITPNRTETELATGLPCNSLEEYRICATHLLEKLQMEAAVLTLDKDGAYVATNTGRQEWLKTRPRRVYDVTGAGDMVLAMLTVARAAGASWHDAVALANVAGGLEVERFGAVPITRPEIVAELLTEIHERLGKQRTLPQLLEELQRQRASGKRIVFTNGCFDLIHLGHVSYFRFAKQQGDLLVVAVNTDDSIRRLKGDKRPIINEHDRISVLEELESIDYLVRFDQDTPLSLIQQIKPDVLVKGADYAKEQIVGWDVVEANGGRVALAPLVDGQSTSGVIKRILQAYGPQENAER